MRPAKIIKILIPALLLATTFFPIYVPNSGGQAVSIYGLLLELPVAFIVPVLFAGSILFAWVDTKWSSVQSAVLAVLGIISAFIVNELTHAGASTPEPYTSIAIILYVLVTPFAYLCFLIRRIFRRKRKAAEPKAAPFLNMPIRQYALFMFLTGGMYQLYWHYVNWKAVKAREGSAISPFWRMAFFILWIYPLFKKIIADGQEHKYPARFSAGLLAGLYALVYLASLPLGFFLTYSQLWVASLVALSAYVLLTIPVQQAANAGGSPKKSSGHGLTIAELIILLFGISLFVSNAVTAAKKPNLTIIGDIRGQFSMVEQTFRLTADYAGCVEDLNARFSTLDSSDQAAVDAYNADYYKCEAIKLELNRLIEELNNASIPNR